MYFYFLQGVGSPNMYEIECVRELNNKGEEIYRFQQEVSHNKKGILSEVECSLNFNLNNGKHFLKKYPPGPAAKHQRY